MQRREVRWELMFPDELESAIAEFPIVYMPYGLCEPHGPQNVLGCDALRPAVSMRTAAEEYGGIVMPAVYWHCHESGTSAVWGHRTIGNTRTWLTSVPPWMFFKNMSYHIRAVDTLGFHGAVIFSGHAGSHTQDFPVFLEIMQRHVATRLHCHMPIGMGTKESRFEDDRGIGGHAGRGETSLLWAVTPEGVDLSRLPPAYAPGPHFAMGPDAYDSDRRAGERMNADIVASIGDTAKELLAEYDRVQPTRAPLTFAQVEDIWEDEVRPELKNFSSMQNGPEAPPEDSQWFANWNIPDRG